MLCVFCVDDVLLAASSFTAGATCLYAVAVFETDCLDFGFEAAFSRLTRTDAGT